MDKELADALDIAAKAKENAQGRRRMCTVPAWVLDALTKAASPSGP